LYQDYFYGDWALVDGKIAEPKNFEDFDYQGYLERYNITAVSAYPKILVLKENRGNFIKYQLLKLKAAFASHIAKYLKEPQGSLLMGVLIGARKTLPQEVVDNFNATGTSHIIAVSGYNISIIIAALTVSAWMLGRRWSFWLSLLVILAFIVLSGASASVIRASVMGALLLLSLNIGRLYAVTPSLCLAAAGMLVFNPKILYWDIGFQLSFAATLGIVYLLPEMEKFTESWPKFWGAKNIVLATLSATAATLSLILLHFGRLSVVALVANVLILPMVPITMLFGFLIAVPVLSPGFALLSSWLLGYILKVVAFLASLPYSSVNLDLNPNWVVLISLLPVGLYYWLRYLNARPGGGVEQRVDL
jgi:competence protein ComEC